MFSKNVYYRRNDVRADKEHRITLTRKNKNYILRKS